MRTLHSASAFDLFDRLEQQLSQQLQNAAPDRAHSPLLSEFRYGTWSRSFRFPVSIEREQLQAVDRDGLLTVTALKANKESGVTVEG